MLLLPEWLAGLHLRISRQHAKIGIHSIDPENVSNSVIGLYFLKKNRQIVIFYFQAVILYLKKALRAGLGGNPFGPAGTGKTESVKALGNLLGRQVLVFNCDEVQLVLYYGIFFPHSTQICVVIFTISCYHFAIPLFLKLS